MGADVGGFKRDGLIKEAAGFFVSFGQHIINLRPATLDGLVCHSTSRRQFVGGQINGSCV